MEKEYFKLKWVESGHYSSMCELNNSKAKFIDYIRDEGGMSVAEREKKTFTDALDWADYETEVWQFSADPERTGSTSALELHPWCYGGAPHGSRTLGTAGDLKRLLCDVAPDTKLLAQPEFRA